MRLSILETIRRVLFGSPRDPEEPEIYCIILEPSGDELTWDDDQCGWTTVVEAGRASFRLVILGSGRPDARLVEQATGICADPEAFMARVRAHLDREAVRQPQWEHEIRGLWVDSVRLNADGQSIESWLRFAGPEDHRRIWSADYRAGQLGPLSFT